MAVLYAVSAFILNKLRKESHHSLKFTVLTLILISIVAANELSTVALSYFYLLMAFFIYIAFSLTQKYKLFAVFLPVLYIFPLVVIGESLFSFTLFDQSFFLKLAFTSVLIINTYLLKKSLAQFNSEEEVETVKSSFKTMTVVSTVMTFSFYWFSLKSLLANYADLYIIVSLTTFTICGLVCYFYGFFKKYSFVQYYGAAVVVSVLIRLFLVDVWTMPIAARIGVFFTVGILLVATAFITTRFKKLD